MSHPVSRSFALVACLAVASIMNAGAQWAPSRPVRLIVPFPPGGAVDVVGRIVASRLPERLGQSVVVDNRGGANAIIGTELAAKAPPTAIPSSSSPPVIRSRRR